MTLPEQSLVSKVILILPMCTFTSDMHTRSATVSRMHLQSLQHQFTGFAPVNLRRSALSLAEALLPSSRVHGELFSGSPTGLTFSERVAEAVKARKAFHSASPVAHCNAWLVFSAIL